MHVDPETSPSTDRSALGPPEPTAVGRRWLRQVVHTLLALGLALGPPAPAAADEVSVPVTLQVALLDRVLRYERGFASETSPVPVIVVTRSTSSESVRITGQLTAELTRVGALGGREIEVTTLSYSSASALRREIDEVHARLVLLSPGLGDAVGAIRTAGAGSGVIVVSTVGAYVDLGATVGFELRSARPRIAVNLADARDQDLHFDPQFLRLTRVVE